MSGELLGSGMSQWIWDTMISMTLLMAVVLILRKPVRHYFGAKVAYFLWALPLARLFMPVLTLEAPVAVPVEPVAEAPATVGVVSEMVAVAPAQVATVSALASVDWIMVAMIVWIGGAGMLFISKLASYAQFREDIVADGQLVGRHGNIRILETAAVGGPLAFGLFQKYIAVPTDFFRNYAPRERELALEHEIAHHESGDLAANFVGLLVLSLHWFNPIAWFSWVAFREDQETACDARILQNSGREVRAVYGRTIAKSASGHQLGLASPLNQKDKIKGRLKMLGQSEKSGLRKKLGAFMVGTSAVVALPLTATVVYAEAEIAHPSEDHDGVQIRSGGKTVDVGDKGVLVTEKTGDVYKYTVSNERGTYEFKSTKKLEKSEIDKKLSDMVPSFDNMNAPSANNMKIPEPPAWPKSASSKGNDDDVINITMLNGSKDFANDKQYVHRIKRDGKTIILRTNRKLSDEDVREMVEEAEESRREADEELREHEREMKEHQRELRLEMREVEREVEQARREASRTVDREVNRALRDSQREVDRSVREALREAKAAEREARSVSRHTVYNARTGQYQPNVNRNHNHNVNRNINRNQNHNVTRRAVPTAPQPPIVNIRSSFITTGMKNGFSSNGPSAYRVAKCKKLGKGVRFDARRGVMTEHTWAALVGCLNVPVAGNDKKYLKLTLETLKTARSDVAKSCQNPDKEHKRRKIEAFDREIEHLQRKLTTV